MLPQRSYTLGAQVLPGQEVAGVATHRSQMEL